MMVDKSCDLSQAEKKITVVKPEQIQKMAIIVTHTQWSKVVIVIENKYVFLICSALHDSYFLLSFR